MFHLYDKVKSGNIFKGEQAMSFLRIKQKTKFGYFHVLWLIFELNKTIFVFWLYKLHLFVSTQV